MAMNNSMKNFEYIYGPVFSWRLGVSLGIDPLDSKEKICNFDCVYCQLGKTHRFETQRKEFVSVGLILREVDLIPDLKIDYFTFAGRGEPTLAKNLGQMIQALKGKKKGKIAVITNAGLMDRRDVQEDLLLADYVIAKLDACSQETLIKVDKSAQDIQFENIVRGIKSFKQKFQGKLAVQIMFIKENKVYARHIADVVRDISPDEVQLDTPLRACGVSPLDKEEMEEIKKYFKGLFVSCVYDKTGEGIKAFDEKQTVRRHGKLRKNIKNNVVA